MGLYFLKKCYLSTYTSDNSDVAPNDCENNNNSILASHDKVFKIFKFFSCTAISGMFSLVLQ